MSKEERLAYMKEKWSPKIREWEDISDAVIPVSKLDVAEEMSLNDGFREFKRDRQTSQEGLTSDEK